MTPGRSKKKCLISPRFFVQNIDLACIIWYFKNRISDTKTEYCLGYYPEVEQWSLIALRKSDRIT